VDIKALFQTNYKSLAVEFDCKDCIGIRVARDLRVSLEMAYFEFPGGGQAHQGNQTGREQSFDYAYLGRVI